MDDSCGAAADLFLESLSGFHTQETWQRVEKSSPSMSSTATAKPSPKRSVLSGRCSAVGASSVGSTRTGADSSKRTSVPESWQPDTPCSSTASTCRIHYSRPSGSDLPTSPGSASSSSSMPSPLNSSLVDAPSDWGESAPTPSRSCRSLSSACMRPERSDNSATLTAAAERALRTCPSTDSCSAPCCGSPVATTRLLRRCPSSGGGASERKGGADPTAPPTSAELRSAAALRRKTFVSTGSNGVLTGKTQRRPSRNLLSGGKLEPEREGPVGLSAMTPMHSRVGLGSTDVEL